MLVETKKIHDGLQQIHRFNNGYGASVVRHGFSYGNEKGLWELAVIKFDANTSDWNLHYDNPVAQGDVCGYLTESDVQRLLSQIEAFE